MHHFQIQTSMLQKQLTQKRLESTENNPPQAEWSMYLFSSSNHVRRLCTTITSHAWFDRFILVCIFYSSLTLALDSPLVPDEDEMRPILVNSDYIMNFVFITECVLKVISQTWTRYISSAWSKLDIIIVLVASIDMTLTAVLSGGVSALGPLKTLRILRALRPLRLIARAPGLRILVSVCVQTCGYRKSFSIREDVLIFCFSCTDTDTSSNCIDFCHVQLRKTNYRNARDRTWSVRIARINRHAISGGKNGHVFGQQDQVHARMLGS